MDSWYIARAVRNAGVPPMWVEDAVQDVLVALWRRGLGKESVWSLAIDAARRYGPITHSGYSRETVSAEAIADKADGRAFGERVNGWERAARHLSYEGPERAVLVRDDLRRAYGTMRGREGLILRSWLAGWWLREIGRALGISESHAAALNREARARARAA